LNSPAKRVRKTWNINFTCLEGIDKASKDIATDLSKLGYFLLLLKSTARKLSKDNAEAGKSAGYYKTNYKAPKELH
jgi:hypothetical protein